MAYLELVSFIKEQLQQGKDARTIRDYLIRRNVDIRAIDAAFDEVFGAKPVHETNKSIEKFVIAGFILLVLVFIGVGVNLYYKLSFTTDAGPIIEQPFPETTPETVLTEEEFKEETQEQIQYEIKICDFQEPEAKYQCYLSKFEKDEIQCHEIEDVDEQEFCYIAQDLYVLNA
ncbi:MAG: hypothetical protein ISS25_00615 [Nanoarchaeota archaeon]|nr:hypothetical protein [DPANN group archaeon]MBL7116319.1 hypothetical protein [Nanoarchaeota archaeon]